MRNRYLVFLLAGGAGIVGLLAGIEIATHAALAQQAVVTPTPVATPAPSVWGVPIDADTKATFNVDQWASILLKYLGGILAIIWTTFVTAYVPPFVRPFVNNIRADKLLKNAIFMIISKAKAHGDIKPDGTIVVDLKNKYLDDFAEYVANNADATLKQWLGDPIAKFQSYLEQTITSTANSLVQGEVPVAPIEPAKAVVAAKKIEDSSKPASPAEATAKQVSLSTTNFKARRL